MSIWRASVNLFLLLVAAHLDAAFSYSHLDWKIPKQRHIEESDYYIVFLVTARHLNYSNSQELFRSLVKHAAGGKNADVGHSWVLLHGLLDGEEVVMEGGQSGELGIDRPKYYDGVMNYYEYGYAMPTREQKQNPRHEPNPIRYLWADVNDGFFQEGNGSFRPTFAAKINLTKEQFETVYEFMNPRNYNYRYYSLVGQQCSSYLAKIAHLVGIQLAHSVTVDINQNIKLWGKKVRLWEDPQYSRITFSNPDAIEKCLMEMVLEGKAENALTWYKKEGKRLRNHQLVDRRDRQRRFWESLVRYPFRLYRAATV